MTEPGTITFVITGTAAAVLGPVLGPYALIVFGAAVGGLLAMSKIKQDSHADGAKFVGIGVLVALVLTGPLVWALQKYTDIPGHIALVPMAFLLGAFRNKVIDAGERVIDAVVNGLAGWIEARNVRRGNGE